MKKLLLVLILVGLGLAGVAYWLSTSPANAVTKDIFTFVDLEKGPMRETVSASGQLQPRDILIVTSEIPGRIVHLQAQINDIVRAGEPLAMLDDRVAKLKLDQAKIELQTAQAALEKANSMAKAAAVALARQEELEKAGAVRWERQQAAIELEAAQAGVRMAKAKLEAARTQLEQAELGHKMTVLQVPVVQSEQQVSTNADRQDYLVLDRNIKIGQMVGPQSNAPLFTLAGDLENMELHTEVVEGDIGKVKKGLKVAFSTTSFGDDDPEFTGVVREIRPLPINVRGAVYYNAVIDTTNKRNPQTGEWRLRPGMTTSVDIVLREREDAWKVAIAALNFEMEEAYLTEAAKQRLREWKNMSDWQDWRPVWIWQEAEQRVWPILVRLSNASKGQVGIRDGEFHEVLEWEPGFTPPTDHRLQLITSAPPATQPGIFDRPANIKLS